jgi:phytoene dehydrogenase-like protein
MDSYVVVGAGLAGLTAANALADRGHRVTILEQSQRPGGRAITSIDGGYHFNLGPHALYRGSHAAKAFRDWKIPLHGGPPEVRRNAYFVIGRRRYPLITGLRRLMTARLLSLGEKLELARLRREITSGQASSEGSAEAWLDCRVRSRRVRDLLLALIRLSTYTADLAGLSARAMRVQMRGAFTEGAIYIDHGWQTLVDGLAARARSLGVEILCGNPVSSLEDLDADGTGIGIVLAVPPASVERITGAKINRGHPVRMACLDLGLRKLPSAAPAFALSIDRPLYFSVHSTAAELAPAGAALVHIGKYLKHGSHDPRGDREELEQHADLLMPGWCAEVEVQRFLPDMTVVHAIAAPEGRPGVDALGMDGVALAGDWVGPDGMLADAAVASGLRAAEAVQRNRNQARTRWTAISNSKT